ncbi:MAG: hypothetical protein ACRC5G_03360 [Cetobacterium sp.]
MVHIIFKTMIHVKNTIKKTFIDTSSYVNVESGEILSSEMPNIISVNNKTEDAIIDYKTFVVIDKSVMKFLKDILPAQEIGRIYNMSSLIQLNWNLLVNDSTKLPHDDITLAEEVALTRNKYYDFMQKMYKLSIVYKLKGYYNGIERTLIILNPFLAKNTSTIKKELLPFFDNLSKIDVQERLRLSITNKKSL